MESFLNSLCHVAIGKNATFHDVPFDYNNLEWFPVAAGFTCSLIAVGLFSVTRKMCLKGNCRMEVIISQVLALVGSASASFCCMGFLCTGYVEYRNIPFEISCFVAFCGILGYLSCRLRLPNENRCLSFFFSLSFIFLLIIIYQFFPLQNRLCTMSFLSNVFCFFIYSLIAFLSAFRLFLLLRTDLLIVNDNKNRKVGEMKRETGWKEEVEMEALVV